MTLDAEFDASPERVWQLWADPRQLERWWGPPTYPATFTPHDLRPGGRVAYYMTGPEGDQPHGYWEIVEADAAASLVFRDGFANEDGSPNTDVPVTTPASRIEEIGDGPHADVDRELFPSTAGDGAAPGHGHGGGPDQAVGQIDAILAGPPSRRLEENPMSTNQTEPKTHTLDVPGAVLPYDVRRNDASTEPVLLLIGSPMGAGRIRHPGRALHRPHGRDLRPPRRGAQQAHRRRHARPRPTSTPTTCTG